MGSIKFIPQSLNETSNFHLLNKQQGLKFSWKIKQRLSNDLQNLKILKGLKITALLIKQNKCIRGTLKCSIIRAIFSYWSDRGPLENPQSAKKCEFYVLYRVVGTGSARGAPPILWGERHKIFAKFFQFA